MGMVVIFIVLALFYGIMGDWEPIPWFIFGAVVFLGLWWMDNR